MLAVRQCMSLWKLSSCLFQSVIAVMSIGAVSVVVDAVVRLVAAARVSAIVKVRGLLVVGSLSVP